MFRKIWIILIAGIFIFGIGRLSFAQAESEEHEHEDEHIEEEATAETGLEEEAVEVGNKICPVSGEEVPDVSGLGMEPAFYEYKGKIYNFCCAGCIEEFKKDPEKYIKASHE